MTQTIEECVRKGVEEGLLKLEDGVLTYVQADKSYTLTDEEQVRAALFVYLVTEKSVVPRSVSIELDKVDLRIVNDEGGIQSIYECKAECGDEASVQAAIQQARGYAATLGVRAFFVAFSQENHLKIRTASMEFPSPVVRPAIPSFPTKIISTINLKGGVGKTSITCALAEFLTIERRKRVLVIDLDPQTNATVVLMGEEQWHTTRETRELTLAHYFKRVLEEKSPSPFDFATALVKDTSNIGGGVRGLDLIPSSPLFIEIQDDIPRITTKRFGAVSHTMVLDKALRPLLKKNQYDYVLIDCPPSLGALTLNGLFMSQFFLVPCIPDWISTYGIPQILKQAYRFSNEHDRPLNCLGVVFSRYKKVSRLHETTVQRYRALTGKGIDSEPEGPVFPKVFDTVIKDTGKAESAVEPDQPVNTLKQKYGYGTPSLYDQYNNLSLEMMQAIDAFGG
jgi:chromosome partitioning protein